MTADDARTTIQTRLLERFGEPVDVPEGLHGLATLAGLAARRVHRRYADRPVDPALVRLLCACALSSPSKSDLQQRDVVVVADARLRASIGDLMPHAPWVAQAPAFLVFCANAERLVRLAQWRGKPFANDHLDLFFNAVGDAAIALATCVVAAEAVGLGTCPISEIRNHAAAIGEWLALPQRVIPFAGLCIGWPQSDGQISPRLPLSATVHDNAFRDEGWQAAIDAYDRRRDALQPYRQQLHVDRYGRAELNGWSEQKARQYSVPLRADFGAFVRAKGFRLD
jgi:nitroreductase/FMN reductase [NAD(P)H]